MNAVSSIVNVVLQAAENRIVVALHCCRFWGLAQGFSPAKTQQIQGL
jgi:hypothetical protein